MMNNNFKHSAIIKPIYFLYDLYYCPCLLKLLFRAISPSKKNQVVLLGTPSFNNLGDHLIAKNEIEFLETIFPDRDIVEIPTQLFKRYVSKIKKGIKADTPVFITGGGWMGNLWPDDELNMQAMIKSFNSYSIFVLPQTVFYDETENNYNEILSRANATYEESRDLFFYFRDLLSLEFAKEKFNMDKTHIRLAPDMGLIAATQGIIRNKDLNEKYVLTCLREDRERMHSDRVHSWVDELCKSNGCKHKSFDTITKKSIPIWKRNSEINRVLLSIKGSNLVITDRLHGMVFSIIAGVPCIAIDNKTHKVLGVYNLWIKRNKRVKVLDYNCSKQELKEAFVSLLHCSESDDLWRQEIKLEFESLSKNIMEAI